MEIGYILLAVLIVLIIWFIVARNSIIARFNAVKRAWSDVNVYERQKEKILSSLEPVVKQYESYESGAFKQIVALRQNIAQLSEDTMDVNKLKVVEEQTQSLLKGLSVMVENYPELKADGIFKKLMHEITEQNENVGAALSIYNRNVEIFNNGIEMFPSNLVNSLSLKKQPVANFVDSTAEKNIEYKPNI